MKGKSRLWEGTKRLMGDIINGKLKAGLKEGSKVDNAVVNSTSEVSLAKKRYCGEILSFYTSPNLGMNASVTKLGKKRQTSPSCSNTSGNQRVKAHV